MVYVLLPADMSQPTEQDTTDIPPDMSPSDSDVLTSELRDRLRYVEGQLEAERQAHAEARRIIAGLVERIPAIEAPEEASTPSGGGEPHPGTVESQEGVQRPWWRKLIRR